jgi:hypothetical protein
MEATQVSLVWSACTRMDGWKRRLWLEPLTDEHAEAEVRSSQAGR